MTGTETQPRRVWTLFVAGAIVLAVVGLVLRFGVVRPPPLATVADVPLDGIGRLAWSTWDDRGSCLHVAEPDGSSRQVRCTSSSATAEPVGWRDGRVVVHSWGTAGELELEIDPATGTVRAEGAVPDGATLPEVGVRYEVERDGGSVVLEVDGRRVWRIEAPDTYDLVAVQRSADGTSLVIQDAADRVLVVPADGGTAPRVWVEDVSAWGPVAWEAADPVDGS